MFYSAPGQLPDEIPAASKPSLQGLKGQVGEIADFVGLLSASCLTGEQAAYLEGIIKSCGALRAQIGEIEADTAADQRDPGVAKTPFNIYAVIRGSVSSAAPAAAKKGVNICYSVNSEVPECLSGDPAGIKKAADTIIADAVNSTAEGDVSASLTLLHDFGDAVRVRLRVSSAARSLRLDSLPGQPCKPISAIDEENSGVAEGLKETVTLLGGRLKVISTPEAGSAVTLDLTLSKTSARAMPFNTGGEFPYGLQTVKISHEAPDPRDLLNILVASGTAENQKLFVRLLRILGYRSVFACGLPQAAGLCAGMKYNLILMDFAEDPVGCAACVSAIKAANVSGGIVVIAVVAPDGGEAENTPVHRFTEGVDDYVPGPLTLSRLEVITKKWL